MGSSLGILFKYRVLPKRRSFGIIRVSSIVSPFNFLDLVGSTNSGKLGLGVNLSCEGSSTFPFFIVSSVGSFIIIFSCVFTICVKVFSGNKVFACFIDFVLGLRVCMLTLGSCKIASLIDVFAKVVFFIFS